MRRLYRAVPVVLVLSSLVAVLWPRGGETVPLYAARTGLMCQTCHFDPNGGGPRNEFGFAFARNRHSLNAEDSTSEWNDLLVTNRLGENLPIYLGLNHRLLLLGNTTAKSDSLDRLGFFNMQNAIHLVFQPHHRLTLVHTRDGATPRESFGMIGGFPFDGYLKAGAFRNPFGLRLDDHTVATRNGFLDFYVPPAGFGASSFLPYDPRGTDQGIEIGARHAGIYGRLSLTNGGSSLFSGRLFGGNPFAEAKTVKLGVVRGPYHGGVSLYDDYLKAPSLFSPYQRTTRWGYFGMLAREPWALLGEVAAGTDKDFFGAETNLLAGFAEFDFAPGRSLNFRVRYDHMNLNRDRTEVAPGIAMSDFHIHDRYSIEGEYVPVPFAELRWALRFIEHKLSRDLGGFEIPDERQAYLQLHFSY